MKYLFTTLIIVLITLNFANSQETEEQAQQIYKNAQQKAASGDYEGAINDFEHAANIYENVGNKQNADISKLNACDLKLNTGKLTGLDTEIAKLLTDAKKVFSENSKIVAYIYSLSGRYQLLMNNYEQAVFYFNKALTINKIVFGENSLDYARSLNDIALLMTQLQNFDSAKVYYTKIIDIYKSNEGENSISLINAYYNLANLFITIGDDDKAIQLNLLSLQILENNKIGYNDQRAKTYSSLANAYMDKGDYTISNEYFEKSNSILISLYGKDNYFLTDNYINLGNLMLLNKQPDFALQYFFLATKQVEKNLQNPSTLAALYNNIGLTYKMQNKLSNAKIFFEKALEIKQQYSNFNDEQTASVMTNLGTIYQLDNQIDSALSILKSTVILLNSIYGLHSPNLVKPLLNIANVYSDLQNLDSSQAYYFKAINANQNKVELDTNFLNISLSSVYSKLNLLEALNGLLIIDIAKFMKNQNVNVFIKTIPFINLSDSLIAELRLNFFSDEDKIRFNEQLSGFFDNSVIIYYYLSKNLPDNQDYKNRLFELIEQNKSATLLEGLVSTQMLNITNIPDSIIKEENNLKSALKTYSQKLSITTDEQEKNFYRDRILQINQDYEKFINTVKIQYPDYYSKKYSLNTISLNELKNKLDDTTTVIDYYLAEDIIFAMVISKDSTTISENVANQKFYDDVNLFNSSITSNSLQSNKNYLIAASELFKYLFFFDMPVTTKRLLIIPHNVIATISFDALLTNNYTEAQIDFKKLPYLINSFQILYDYSATLFYETRKLDYSSISRTDLLCMAPVFKPDNPQTYNSSSITTIIGSETEVNNINKIFTDDNFNSKMLLNKYANENLLKILLRNQSYKVIHIATHGYVDFNNPDLSALILSRDSLNIDDGILYSGEIYNLKLNADLVILSACETAMGKIYQGEGVVGLSRAFIYAGAKNLIISLWKVSDIATNELMTKFYDNLLSETKDLSNYNNFNYALYKAKLSMINTKYSHPFFWSAFILVGQ